jgi:hypothetical protein
MPTLSEFVSENALGVKLASVEQIVDDTLKEYFRSEESRARARTHLENSSQWVAFVSAIRPGDLTYLCTSAPWTWGAAMCGREWIVAVRGGEVVAQYRLRMS